MNVLMGKKVWQCISDSAAWQEKVVSFESSESGDNL